MDRIAYTLLKIFEVITVITGVCISVYMICLLIALLAEIHPAFWLLGVILPVLSVYFFFSYNEEWW